MGVVAGITIDAQIVVLGAITGLTYALLGVGLVLVYRATRVINFAHGEMGAFGAALLAQLVLDLHWNWYATFALMVVVGGLIGAVVELAIIRRLFHTPRLVVLVATIGVAQILFFAQAALPDIDNVARYPSPLDRTMTIGGVLLRSEHLMVLAFVPAIVAGLVLFLNRTPYGIAIRAAADNGDAAELAGISTKRVSTTVWVLAGMLATVTAILVNPVRGVVIGLPSVALGPGLLLRALAAGMFGRLTNLPLTVAGGVVLGIVEAVLFANVGNPGAADAAIFVLVLVLVLVRARGMTDDATEGWSLTPKLRALPAQVRDILWVRRLPWIATAAVLGVALLLPIVFSSSERLFLFGRVLVFAIVALSVTVVTGWSGQLSLCQFALVGIGSMATAALVNRGMPFGAAVAYGTVGGALVALAIGAPALRIRGLYLAVTTLAFAVAARGWLLGQEVFTGDATVVTVRRGQLGPLDFDQPRTYYYLCLVVLVATIAMTSRLRGTGIGRSLIAVRENERAAAAFTVSPTVAKLTAFALAGALAALAGGLLAGLRVQFGPEAFGVDESLRVVAMTIIGGLGSVAGAVLGAVYVIGLPAAFGDSEEIKLLTSGTGLLILLLYFPGGLVQLVYKLRDVIVAQAVKRVGDTPSAATATVDVPAAAPAARGNGSTPARPEPPPDVPAVRARDVTVHFGGVHALDGVSIEAAQGEVVGLIGSNGAGKSTLMNVIGGFLPAGGGTVELFGTDVTALAPHERARLGMGRVFQDARLFGDLTVREAVLVALEGRERSELVPSLLALGPSRRAESRKVAEAAELVAFVGLGRYADRLVADLSTGTRRITELACQIALDSRVLLLDEPTAGVAQRETEAFGPLIRRIQAELHATLVIIEHDIPLVLSICDRVYCLGAGRVIAEGEPEQVRLDPAVIASYLGTDERAVARSGAAAVVREAAT